jgi:hypothetical protein
MSRSVSRRAIAAVAILLVLAGGLVIVLTGAPAPAAGGVPRPMHATIDLGEAVRRTVAQPAARIHLDLRPPKGPPLTIAGVAGLGTDDLDLSLSLAGRADRATRLRVVGPRAWIGGPGLPWLAMPASSVRTSPATSWRDLLRTLRPDPHARSGVTLAGHAATVELDGRGRLHRVRADLPNSTFDLVLDGYDDDLDIVPPP